MLAQAHPHPWIVWPFILLAKLIAFVVIFALRLAAVVVGGVFVLVGLLLSLTLIGAIIGLPLMFVGAVLVFKGIF